ncbi:MAG TPA: S-methyl-5-thioribose-1-phosphate isomerase [Actinomycetota bacterium]|nr:S-methyl-5-thioribose-1-phosphate isomerase [Actinomycetota bacterium]
MAPGGHRRADGAGRPSRQRGGGHRPLRLALVLRLSSDPDPADVPTIAWRGDHLEVIDQTLLPGRLEVRSLKTVADVVDALQRLVVRGAPAIGVCGAFGIVLGLDERHPAAPAEVHECLRWSAGAVGGARPTAVNLAWAANRVAAVAAVGATYEEARSLALEEAQRIQEADRRSARLIGEIARLELTDQSRLMTYCNAGRLASAGIGTALAVAYAKADAGEPVEVLACETRPLLQGARLTAWELSQAGVPVTLIPDGAAGAALAAGRADAVVVGCDRVAANGDTANKIGTFSLAVLAHAAGIPFYVAGPMTTFDLDTPTGAGIVIEERSADEVRSFGGRATAPDVAVWNPAFDVTPARLITAFLTDAGVLRPPFGPAIAEGVAEAVRQGLRPA